MCPLATSPCLSALLVCLSSICCFKGCHVSWRQARYRTTCKLAEPKYSTAFDKNEKPLVQERVCLCRLPCASRRASCCATSFRSATFRDFAANFRDFHDFPRLSATFRQFPRLSAPFAGAVEKYPAIFRTISANFLRLSANSRSAVCTAWAWSHCAVELVVHSCSAPGERCGCCSNVRPTEGFPQQQSRLLMQCEKDMQCMTTIK